MIQYNKAAEIDPNYYYINLHLGRLYRKQGNYKEAIEVFKEIGDNLALGYTYAVSGERDKAVEILNEFLEQSKKGRKPFATIAIRYGVLGENDKAFEWLEKAYEERQSFPLLWIKTDYEWDPLRSDPRFTALLKKMGLPTE